MSPSPKRSGDDGHMTYTTPAKATQLEIRNSAYSATRSVIEHNCTLSIVSDACIRSSAIYNWQVINSLERYFVAQ
jgi:hypothetical protein